MIERAALRLECSMTERGTDGAGEDGNRPQIQPEASEPEGLETRRGSSRAKRRPKLTL